MSAAGVQTMLACVTCDEAVRLMKEEGVCEQVLEHIVRRINEHINVRTHDELETGVVIFPECTVCLASRRMQTD